MDDLLKEVGATTEAEGFEIARAVLKEAGREEAIEGVAKEICRLRGENPYTRRREFGQSSWDYWAWEDYRAEAMDAIDYVLSEE